MNNVTCIDPARSGRLRPGLVGLLVLAVALAGCTAPRLDSPSKVRQTDVFLPPLFSSSSSPDGTSHAWNALIWLVGEDTEGERTHSRALPFWWHDADPPYSENTLVFPFWYSRTTPESRTRFWSILYGYQDTPDLRTDYVIPPIFWWQRSKTADENRYGVFLLWDWRHVDSRTDWTLLPILGLAHLAHWEGGYPGEGVRVPALGRESSRRFTLLNLLGLVELFGYDDVGDTRDIRVLTFLSSEMLSPLRSRRGRGDDPFVREWIFPLYMNVQDDDGGWSYVGPLWGERSDRAEGTRTDWWLLGLVSHTTPLAPAAGAGAGPAAPAEGQPPAGEGQAAPGAPAEGAPAEAWKILGISVSGG